ncbi:MAG: 2Fe-2S iron-sulfur cluster-binding protein, partial [Candidatus Thorarchaeota archaeon]
MAKRVVLFEPSGIRIAVDERITVLQAARNTGLHISSECGGRGTCGKCSVVMIPAPDPSERDFKHLSSSQIEEGSRLACQHNCRSNMRVVLTPAMGQIKILSDSIANENAIDI